MPQLKGTQRIFWFAFGMAYAIGWWPKVIATVACLLGICKKAGIPSYSAI
jgi:hypothetical protein